MVTYHWQKTRCFMLETEVFICKWTPVDAADSSSITLHKRNWQGEKEERVINLDVLQFTTCPPGGQKDHRFLSFHSILGRPELTFTKSPPWIIKSFITLKFKRKNKSLYMKPLRTFNTFIPSNYANLIHLSLTSDFNTMSNKFLRFVYLWKVQPLYPMGTPSFL